MTGHDDLYQRWIVRRRGDRPTPEFSDRVMTAVTRIEAGRRASRLVSVLLWIDHTRSRRLAACAAALLIGSLPFVYLAHISKAFVS